MKREKAPQSDIESRVEAFKAEYAALSAKYHLDFTAQIALMETNTPDNGTNEEGVQEPKHEVETEG